MTREQVEVFAHVYVNNVEAFYTAEAKKLIGQLRSFAFASPEFRRSKEGEYKRDMLNRIEERLEEGLITGKDACDASLDTMAQP